MASHREGGMEAVRKDEPLGKSSSLVASEVVARLEELCVQALSAGFLDGSEDSGAQLGAVRFLAACSCAFGHCDV